MIKAKKSLGQNFLIDNKILDQIVNCVEIENKNILEIGPGTGNLTKYILDKNIMIKGEYQITTVLENLKNKNLVFVPHKIEKWFDFGTPLNLLKSHAEILKKETPVISHQVKNSTIIDPC